jgi:CheY-like chemotaxis protein
MGTRKILIVEDNAILSLINKKHIELIGLKVIAVASNGLDAIEAARKHEPDVILMDIKLKGEMNGIEAMIEIGKFSKAPAIYLSGNSDVATRAEALKTNMIAFCVKPVFFEELQKLLQSQLL